MYKQYTDILTIQLYVMPSLKLNRGCVDLSSPVMPASSKQKDSLIDYGMGRGGGGMIQSLQDAKKKIKIKKKNSCNLPFNMQLVLIVGWVTEV